MIAVYSDALTGSTIAIEECRDQPVPPGPVQLERPPMKFRCLQCSEKFVAPEGPVECRNCGFLYLDRM